MSPTDLHTWLDVDKLGRSGLFEDIAAGLAHAKVIVACVSDSYAKSDNCRMEFLHASRTLRLRVILAVVGCGFDWTRSEIGTMRAGARCSAYAWLKDARCAGMLSSTYPTVNFRVEGGWEDSMQELVALVRRNVHGSRKTWRESLTHFLTASVQVRKELSEAEKEEPKAASKSAVALAAGGKRHSSILESQFEEVKENAQRSFLLQLSDMVTPLP